MLAVNAYHNGNSHPTQNNVHIGTAAQSPAAGNLRIHRNEWHSAAHPAELYGVVSKGNNARPNPWGSRPSTNQPRAQRKWHGL